MTKRIFLIFSIVWITGLFIISLISIMFLQPIYYLIMVLSFPFVLLIVMIILLFLDFKT